jgi:hypothetical protein
MSKLLSAVFCFAMLGGLGCAGAGSRVPTTGESGAGEKGAAPANDAGMQPERPGAAAKPANAAASGITVAAGAPATALDPSRATLLPALDVRVERQDGDCVIHVRTQTPAPGWKVELAALQASDAGSEAMSLKEFRLVGTPPAQAAAAPKPEERKILHRMPCDPSVATVMVWGKYGGHMAAIPEDRPRPAPPPEDGAN